jgi:hypothetical protein
MSAIVPVTPARIVRRLLAFFLVATMLVILPAAPARAQTTITDCSEADAIRVALEGGGIFIFDCGPGAVVDLSSVDIIRIGEGTTTIVEGNGVSFDGGQRGAIFDVQDAGTSLTLDHVTLTGGRRTNISVNNEGVGDLDGFSTACGGAIFIEMSSVTITNSTVASNAIDISMMATSTGGNVNLSAVARGGAICNFGGTLSVANTTFSDNGAVVTVHAIAAGDATVTIHEWGGAIFNSAGGTVDIVNSTFSANRLSATATAQAGDQSVAIAETSGAAIYNDIDAGAVSLRHVTVTNSQLNGAAVATSTGGTAAMQTPVNGAALSNASSADFTLSNTIIAEDDACSGGMTTLGYNLAGDADTSCLPTPAATDQIVSDALLRPLTDNGGPTRTHVPALNSPAIDQGNCPTLTTDQRGLPRVVDRPPANAADGCDIGAVEFQDIAFDAFDLRSGSNELELFPDSVRQQAGDPIYVRFTLGGPFADSAIATILVKQISCSGGNPIGSAQPAQSAGGLRYFANTDTYQLIWRTQTSWANTCRQLIIQFTDGSEVRFNVEFTRNR